MKMAFFAYIPDGRVSGFCQWRADGNYASSGHGLDAATRAENNPLDEDETLIDVVDCHTFNDAKRHVNVLAGRDPEDGIDAWGDEVLTAAPPLPARMICPYCNTHHVDEGEWETRPHHKHKCLHCGKLFRFEGADGEYFYGVAG